MKQRGKRIRPSGKDLVFHFTIASLLPVFLLVVGLFHVCLLYTSDAADE